MPYGCGNYMYRGDPGFFGNVFRAVGHVVGGAALGLITGGPLGGIKGAIGGAISGTASNIGAATLAAGDDPRGDAARLAAAKRLHAQTLASHPMVHAGAGTGRALGAGAGGLGRRRRMNWANGKALGRAERRIHSAVKHMSRYFRWVHPVKAGHLAPAFKKHKRRAA